MEKIIVWRTVEENINYDLAKDIDEAIAFLQGLKKKYPDKKLRLDVDICYEGESLRVQYEDSETDDEYTRRIRNEKELEKRIEAEERKKLAELKAKYECEVSGKNR